MDVKVHVNAEARRATIWTDADTSPATVGQALDTIFGWPDFRPGIQVLEMLRGATGPAIVTRAIRALGNRARRLGIRRWAIVTGDNTDGLAHRTWAGIAGAVIVRVGAFDSVVAALDWLNMNEPEESLISTPPPLDVTQDQRSVKRNRFNSPSATGFMPMLTKPVAANSGNEKGKM